MYGKKVCSTSDVYSFFDAPLKPSLHQLRRFLETIFGAQAFSQCMGRSTFFKSAQNDHRNHNIVNLSEYCMLYWCS